VESIRLFGISIDEKSFCTSHLTISRSQGNLGKICFFALQIRHQIIKNRSTIVLFNTRFTDLVHSNISQAQIGYPAELVLAQTEYGLQIRTGYPVAGAWVSLQFLESLFTCRPAVEPEAFNTCPVLLTQPAADDWTPLDASRDFFDRLSKPRTIVMLKNEEHYPIESPAVEQLVEAMDDFIRNQLTTDRQLGRPNAA
jgi:pimeloyl-ACP methyl ester carboxylesterase